MYSATSAGEVWAWHSVLVISLFQRPISFSVLSGWQHCHLRHLVSCASSVLCHPREVWWLVAPMTGILTLSAEALSPPRSGVLKFKSHILCLGWVMVVNTFHHSQDLVFLFGLFPALHYRDSSLLWCLIIKEGNLIRKSAVVPSSPLTQTHNCSFDVGPSGRKDAGFHRTPGAMLTPSLPAPWESGRCPSHGL